MPNAPGNHQHQGQPESLQGTPASYGPQWQLRVAIHNPTDDYRGQRTSAHSLSCAIVLLQAVGPAKPPLCPLFKCMLGSFLPTFHGPEPLELRQRAAERPAHRFGWRRPGRTAAGTRPGWLSCCPPTLPQREDVRRLSVERCRLQRHGCSANADAGRARRKSNTPTQGGHKLCCQLGALAMVSRAAPRIWGKTFRVTLPLASVQLLASGLQCSKQSSVISLARS